MLDLGWITNYARYETVCFIVRRPSGLSSSSGGALNKPTKAEGGHERLLHLFPLWFNKMPPERDDPWHGRTRRTRDPNPESGFGFNPSFSLSRSLLRALPWAACALALKHERESVHQQGSRADAEASRHARIRASPAQPLDRDPSNTQRTAARAGSYGIQMLHKLGSAARHRACLTVDISQVWSAQSPDCRLISTTHMTW